MEARRQREREASLARVRELTALAMAEEQRRARRHDRVAWAALGLSTALLALLGVAMIRHRGVLPLLCPALALMVVAALVVRLRGLARRP